MKLRELQQADLTYMAENARDKDYYKQPLEQIDYMYALEHDDDILMIGGFRMITDTTAWAWMDLSYAGLERIYTCYRILNEWIHRFCKQRNIARLEACVEVGFEAGVNLATHLGFKYESRKKNFFGNRPADLYVRFF